MKHCVRDIVNVFFWVGYAFIIGLGFNTNMFSNLSISLLGFPSLGFLKYFWEVVEKKINKVTESLAKVENF